MNLYKLEENAEENDNVELIYLLAEGKNIRIERILSFGSTTGWYNQDEFEFVSVIQGSGRIKFDDGSEKELRCGDNIIIPPNKKHSVVYTSKDPPCIWLCVFWKE